MAYSAVSQPPAPGPLALSQGGRSRSIMAVHRTRVLPKETSTLPPAWRVKWRWKADGAELIGAAAVVAGEAVGFFLRKGLPKGRS